ncbi:pyrimidine 5'-nucleotidase [Polymorphobacter sp. PAMC 29334]|uniref:pyrimidine 5'-nucleotidase n=1 Tax=Polymorphobacter sp. PAMC 29334 TaxID=2862331 RepID=UPI001C75C094|nr:pyrimidine 5'-nucleotidase [Polymorphobacter sp. PAMC 29334]QYE35936.1 pyrimidine 5'-nucleotidase [Polymorphobacter sp. PAMC 29334]
MPHPLSHIDAWIFDLDNTLYPAKTNLFAQIDARMGAYVARLLGVDAVEAHRVQKGFFHQHGTTLRGLMDEHGVDPLHFLDDVHDIDLSVVDHAPLLVESIARLPGRKLVFTNADTSYAAKVLDRLGLEGAFEAIYDVHSMAYLPKPDVRAYRGLCETHGVNPARALFADDMERNLAPAKAIGMATVWVDNGSEQGPRHAAPDFIDYRITDVSDWLAGVVTELEAA